MNLKNLEGKTVAQQKDLYEIELIADFEMEYGQEDKWTEEQELDFNKKWDEIQKKFKPVGNKI